MHIFERRFEEWMAKLEDLVTKMRQALVEYLRMDVEDICYGRMIFSIDGLL